jgi:hypothetical protein
MYVWDRHRYSPNAACLWTSCSRLGHRDPTLLSSVQEKGAVESAIKEAEDKCTSGTSGECAAAWDNVSIFLQHWHSSGRVCGGCGLGNLLVLVIFHAGGGDLCNHRTQEGC